MDARPRAWRLLGTRDTQRPPWYPRQRLRPGPLDLGPTPTEQPRSSVSASRQTPSRRFPRLTLPVAKRAALYGRSEKPGGGTRTQYRARTCRCCRLHHPNGGVIVTGGPSSRWRGECVRKLRSASTTLDSEAKTGPTVGQRATTARGTRPNNPRPGRVSSLRRTWSGLRPRAELKPQTPRPQASTH